MTRLCKYCSKDAVSGGSRCSRHGGKARASGPNLHHDPLHQELRKKVLKQATGCANPECRYEIGPGNPLEADHIIPLRPRDGREPGRTELSNYQALCRRCNRKKGNR